MMPQPGLVAETFRLLSTHLEVPVTGKIRLGWNATQQNFLEIGKILEDNGAALIAMHGRTKEQKYGDSANWQAIAELKQVVSVPVIGNGDVVTAADIQRMKAQTGCDAVMIGRAAIGNPWIFARQDRTELCFPEVVRAIRLHGREMAAYYGERNGLIQFRKHLKRYLADIPGISDSLERMLAVVELADFEALLLELEMAVPPSLPLSELLQRETAVV
jgi:tRNA-dihydrouridine synthase